MMKLRPIEFVEMVYGKRGGGHSRWVEGEPEQGLFHCFTSEMESGGNMEVVAVIEMPDGRIKTPMAHKVKFLDPWKEFMPLVGEEWECNCRACEGSLSDGAEE